MEQSKKEKDKKKLEDILKHPNAYSFKNNPIEAARNFRKFTDIPIETIVNFIMECATQNPPRLEVADIFLKKRHTSITIGRNFREEIRDNPRLTAQLSQIPTLEAKLTEHGLL